MALTITDAGNATSTTSTATLVTGATITAAAGDWLVAVVAADNQGASGAASLTTVQDSAGNTWTQRVKMTNSSASAANDGATLGIYTCQVTNALAGGTVTANFSPNTTAKAMQVYRVQPGAGETIQFVAADTTGATGASVSTISAPTVAVTNGDTIFGCSARERQTATTGDSDTTNGSWSTLADRIANTGVAGSSMVCASQYKTVNATGSQTWDTSWTGLADCVATYLILGPLAVPAAPVFNPNPMLPLLVR